MRRIIEIIIPGAGIVIGLLAPLVPVWYAPVIPDPNYHFRLISAFQAILSVVFPLVGISYRWAWYTPVVILLAPAAGFALGSIACRALLTAHKG